MLDPPSSAMRGSNSGILLCLALRAALQPRPAGAQAPASEQCDTATFSIQAGSVDEACCDGVTNCPDGGVPEQCNAACAEVFSVFYDRCHDMLSAQFSPTEMASYDQFYSTCSSNSSGRPEDICSTPHQVQEVARQVTTTCQGTQGTTASGGLSLPAHCAADCAAVFLPWFGDGHGSCFAALHLDEMTVQVFASFAESCRGENSGVDMSGAIFVPPSGGSPESMLLCFDASCGAAPVLEQRGAVVLEGCVAGGSLGAVCRLGCRAGYTMASAQDGQCTLSEVGTVAIYSGQTVACSPVREALDSLMRSLPLRFFHLPIPADSRGVAWGSARRRSRTGRCLRHIARWPPRRRCSTAASWSTRRAWSARPPPRRPPAWWSALNSGSRWSRNVGLTSRTSSSSPPSASASPAFMLWKRVPAWF